MRVCIDCGVSITHRGSRAVRCEACSEARGKKRYYPKKPKPKKKDWLIDRKPQSEQCKTCYYFSDRLGFCDFFDITGKTRSSLHGNRTCGLNDPCQEYKEREVGKRVPSRVRSISLKR